MFAPVFRYCVVNMTIQYINEVHCELVVAFLKIDNWVVALYFEDNNFCNENLFGI